MKKIVALAFMLLIFYPKFARADLDLLSTIQDIYKVYNEKISGVVQKYLGMQVNLQEVALSRDPFNNLRKDVENQLKDKANGFIDDAKKAAWDGTKEFLNKNLSSITLPGLNNAITLGPYTTPQLKQQVGKSFLKRKNLQDDVVVNTAIDMRNNNLMVENLATIYANALVTRRKMLDEEKETAKKVKSEEEADGNNNSDVGTIQYRYGQAARTAAMRWLDILSFESVYYKGLAEMFMTVGRVDNISEIIGEDESKVEVDESIAENLPKPTVDYYALKDKVKSSYNLIKQGDYAGALNSAAGAYGTAAIGGDQKLNKMITDSANSAGNAYNAAKSGNWEGVTTNVGSASGEIIGGNIGSGINAAGQIIGGGIGAGTSGDNAYDVFDNALNNGNIESGINNLDQANTAAKGEKK